MSSEKNRVKWKARFGFMWDQVAIWTPFAGAATVKYLGVDWFGSIVTGVALGEVCQVWRSAITNHYGTFRGLYKVHTLRGNGIDVSARSARKIVYDEENRQHPSLVRRFLKSCKEAFAVFKS